MSKKGYIKELAKRTGIKERTLYSRIFEKGWTEDKATNTPITKHGKANVQIGYKNNKLTVIEYVGMNKLHKAMVKCKCDCGNIIITRYADVKSGNTKSCGCQLIESVHNRKDYHGKMHERVYQSWRAMKLRCYNEHSEKYKNYGGRGIAVCVEWKDDFMAFYKWAIDNGYRDNLTIDRIDVNGNYEPSNCRWVTMKQQARNKQYHKNYTINGVTKCLAEWCEIYNVKYGTVLGRLYRGWSIERALGL